MGIRADAHPQHGGPPKTPLFPGDSVLERMARGSYKPTEADLAELDKLAQSGNRAERRAAAKHLKKQGMAAPPATPRAPVAMPVVASTAAGERAPAESAVPTQAQAMKAPKQAHALMQSPRSKTPQEKAAVKGAAAKQPSARKTAGKKAAAKKAAPTKRARGKAATNNLAVKKTAIKKAAKKAPARKPRRK